MAFSFPRLFDWLFKAIVYVVVTVDLCSVSKLTLLAQPLWSILIYKSFATDTSTSSPTFPRPW